MLQIAFLVSLNLGLIDFSKISCPLPWRPPTNIKRNKEDVCPIFWANRPRSYISRTTAWDEFHRGRWGDTRSPAYGSLSDHQFLRKWSCGKKMLAEWAVPLASVEAVNEKFAKYCAGELSTNPWSELEGLQPETVHINEKLLKINNQGFLTINSQPAVNGEKSDSPSIGRGVQGVMSIKRHMWSSSVPSENLHALIGKVKEIPSLTYIAVNAKDETQSNIGPTNVNAVTWGVFPGKEVIQPTVVDPVSFIVWKDEAFQAWEQDWASLYPEGDESKKILLEIKSSYFLVSNVDNDYINGDLFSVFAGL